MKRIALFLTLSLLICLNSLAQSRTRIMSDGERRISYVDVPDAEKKLKQYHEERKQNERNGVEYSSGTFPCGMFQDLILNDERTLYYDFSFEDLYAVSSHDKSIKVYHISGVDELLLSCVINGEYCVAYIENEYDGYYKTLNLCDLHCVKRGDGFMTFCIYLGYECTSYDLNMSAYTIYKSGKVQKTPLFEDADGNLQTTLDHYVELNMTSKQDFELLYNAHIKCDNREITVPLLVPGVASPSGESGRVERWVYDGSVFRYAGITYSKEEIVNAKLRNYSANVAILNLEPWTIRIDLMPDGFYRYSSWKNKDMSQEADLVLMGGINHSVDISNGDSMYACLYMYLFRNGDYSYIVSYECDFFGGGAYECTSPKLVVKFKNEKDYTFPK
ncbi:MAG: hypothetical protein IKV07_03520 [Bacteroidaceae bacterium]|nr:hypothetical protein [Bacteroidaceae bacterium]